VIPTLDGHILELVPHCASVRPADWSGDHSERPLTQAGHQQAATLADRIGPDVAAICSSPMLRCMHTVQPLARATGLPIEQLPELRDTQDFGEPRTWKHGPLAPIADPVAGAWAAGRGLRALLTIAERHPGSRVVAASHGDLIPILLAMLCASYEVAAPEVGPDRGGWWTLRFGDATVGLTAHASLVGDRPLG
jgi:broad specificity phosphatase PhoE